MRLILDFNISATHGGGRQGRYEYWLIGQRVAGAAGDLNEESGNALRGIFWWAAIDELGSCAAYSNFGPKNAALGQADHWRTVVGAIVVREDDGQSNQTIKPVGTPDPLLSVTAAFQARFDYPYVTT